MTFLDLAIPMLPVIILLCVVFTIRSKRNKYNKWLNKTKVECEYQTIKLDALINVYKAIGSNSFRWDYTGSQGGQHLLWYRIPAEDDYPRFCTHWKYFLIDIPWFSCVLFRIWEKRHLRQKAKAEQEVARCKNSTDDVLQDIQKKLESQIQRNCEEMKKAAVQQGQVLSRISEFEKDYIKSQITQIC